MIYLNRALFLISFTGICTAFVCHAHAWEGDASREVVKHISGLQLEHKEQLYDYCDTIGWIGFAVFLLMIVINICRFKNITDNTCVEVLLGLIISYLCALCIYVPKWFYLHHLPG